MEILETFPPVFCFPKSHINENGGNLMAKTMTSRQKEKHCDKRKRLKTKRITSRQKEEPQPHGKRKKN